MNKNELKLKIAKVKVMTSTPNAFREVLDALADGVGGGSGSGAVTYVDGDTLKIETDTTELEEIINDILS